MIAFIIAPFALALFIFIYLRTVKHLKRSPFFINLFILVAFALYLFGGVIIVIVAFFLPISNFKALLTKASFYWLGFLLYFFVSLIIALLCRYVIWLFSNKEKYNKHLSRHITIAFIVVFTTIISIYGINNAHNLHITNYDVTIDKECDFDELNVVLISDLHIGYNDGLKQMQDMVDKVNSLNPDVIVVAGDIFDNEYEAIEEPEKIIEVLSTMKAKYGKYAVYGNHDIEEKILLGFTFHITKEDKANVQADERMNEFVEKAGLKLLYDSYELINNSFYIYGRPDAQKINFGNTERVAASDITNDLDKSLPIIVLDHQPKDLNELSAAGVDLDLCGHTHAGQVWPGTLTINLMWDNAYGLKKYGNMTNIVTSGVGLFGPNMRVGSVAEICNINIKFK